MFGGHAGNLFGVKNFAWRVVVNSLPTWQNKHNRGLEENDVCPICDIETESYFHALCRCPLAVGLWKCMNDVWRLPKLQEITNTGVEWLLDVLFPLSQIEKGHAPLHLTEMLV